VLGFLLLLLALSGCPPMRARSLSDMERLRAACREDADPLPPEPESYGLMPLPSLATRRKYFWACVRTCVALRDPTKLAIERTSFGPNLCSASINRLCSSGVQYRDCVFALSCLARSFSLSASFARSASISRWAEASSASSWLQRC
jgi:hypothetical protein